MSSFVGKRMWVDCEAFEALCGETVWLDGEYKIDGVNYMVFNFDAEADELEVFICE